MQENQSLTTLPQELESALATFAKWRENKKQTGGRIPEELWTMAVRLSAQYTVSKVAHLFQLQYQELKRRFQGKSYKPKAKKKRPAEFFEMPTTFNPVLMSGRQQPSNIMIQITEPDGRTINVRAGPNFDFVRFINTLN